jgi:pimeloyl-ACP methyl ester carboxylesterase
MIADPGASGAGRYRLAATMPARLPQRLQRRQVAPPPGAFEGRPWRGHSLREVRWQAELARLSVDPVFRGRGVAPGDGSPVVLVPGFLAGDWSLRVLQRWLRRIGYSPEPSGIFFNVDCSDRSVRRLEATVQDFADRTGARVAIVGHSRGGHFAKALAHRRPDLVRGVVTLGTGLDALYDVSVPMQRTARFVAAVHARTTDRRERRGCLSMACRCDFTRDYWAAFPSGVPLTSIYSKRDGVVRWESCVVPYATCVEVRSSHVGLAVNRHAYRALAAALARR